MVLGRELLPFSAASPATICYGPCVVSYLSLFNVCALLFGRGRDSPLTTVFEAVAAVSCTYLLCGLVAVA